jgi:hypothetical protein
VNGTALQPQHPATTGETEETIPEIMDSTLVAEGAASTDRLDESDADPTPAAAEDDTEATPAADEDDTDATETAATADDDEEDELEDKDFGFRLTDEEDELEDEDFGFRLADEDDELRRQQATDTASSGKPW